MKREKTAHIKINGSIDQKDLKHRIDQIFHSNVKALSFAFTMLFLIFILGHVFVLKSNNNMILLTSMSFLLLLAIMNVLSAVRFPHHLSHPIAVVLVLVVLLNSIQYIKMTHDLIQITNVLLLIIGCGIFFLSFKWYFISVFLIMVAVLFELILFNFTEHWRQITFAISISFYVSFLANYLRINSTRKFQVIFMQSQKHRAKLEDALLELRQSKDHAMLLNRVVPSAIFTVDTNYVVTNWNEKAEQITGYSSLESVGKKCDFFIKDSSSETCNIFDVEVSTPVYNVECEILTKDGGVKIISKNADLLNDKNGNLIGAIESFEDITVRKVAEESLRKSEEKYRSIFDLSPEAILLTNADGIIIDVNTKVNDWLGYQNDELFGLNLLESPFIPRKSKLTMQEKFKQALTGNGMMTYELEFISKNGDVLFGDVLTAPLKGLNKKTVGNLIVIPDITERKKAAEQKAKLFSKINSINKELKEFAYVVSHDLKAPLRAINSLATWLVMDYEDKFDEDGKKQLHLLQSRVTRMDSLIDGILQYSRVGRVEEDKVEIVLQTQVPEIIDYLAPPENIIVTIDTDLPTIVSEKTRITQVFQNLMSNAIKYMDKPEGTINIGCVKEDEFYEFYVRDNGPGIEEKYFERIFKIFQTLHAKDQYESTGVGLTLIKRIVEMYGGKVWLESEVGNGCTFYFTLPLHPKSEDE
jgi:PAS domain S-box-containing protein